MGVLENETLAVGAALEPLTSVDASNVPVDPSPLREAHRLRFLNLTGNEAVISLDFLQGTLQLERLNLSNLELLPDIAPIGQLSFLQILNLGFNPNLKDLSPLAPLASLRWIDLSADERITDFDPLAALTGLEILILNDCTPVQSLTFLLDLPRLRSLSALGLHQLSDLGPLSTTGIETLRIGGHEITDGAPIGRMPALTELSLQDLPALRDLSFLNKLEQLRSLDIVAYNGILPVLALPVLERALFANCPNIQDLSGLTGLGTLRALSLEGLPVSDLAPLSQLSHLTRLSLPYCRGIRDLAPLSRLPLRQIDLTGCDPDIDITQLPSDCQIIR